MQKIKVLKYNIKEENPFITSDSEFVIKGFFVCNRISNKYAV